MTAIEKNRLAGVAFLALGAFHLVTLMVSLGGFTLITSMFESKTENSAGKADTTAADNGTLVIPGPYSMDPTRSGRLPAASPDPKTSTAAQRTITFAYIWIGVQLAALVFVVIGGFMILNVNGRGRMLGMVAAIFLVFYYPLGTLAAIFFIWFALSDECQELYAEAENDYARPQSIV